MPSDRHEKFSKETLAAQNGRKVPLTLGMDGPVIGEATMKYNPETGNLSAELSFNNPRIGKLLSVDSFSFSIKKES